MKYLLDPTSKGLAEMATANTANKMLTASELNTSKCVFCVYLFIYFFRYCQIDAQCDRGCEF